MSFLKKILKAIFRDPLPFVTVEQISFDVAVIPALGAIDGEGPGRSNLALAGKAIHSTFWSVRKLIPQIQVFNACPKSFQERAIYQVRFHTFDRDQLTPIKRLSFWDKIFGLEGKRPYIDTFEVLSQAKKHLESLHRPLQIVLICHPHHAWRCYWTARKMGFEVELLNTGPILYEPRSDQIETRSPWLWIPYDRLAGVIHVLKGYI